MNEFIIMLFFIIAWSGIYLLYKFFQKESLYICFSVMLIFTILFSIKTIPFLGFNMNMHIPLYTSTMICFCLLMEKISKKEKKQPLYTMIFTSIITFIFLMILSFYTPSITSNDIFTYKEAILNNYRTLIACIICLISESYLTAKLYPILKKELESPFICLCLLSITLGLIESFLFGFISYLSILPNKTIMELIFSNYIIKLMFTCLSVPLFIYIDKIKKVKKND